MQISVSGDAINLSRYGGTVTENGTRKTLSVRVGSFPSSAKAEFNQSATADDAGRIPYLIYRTTTPDEQQQMLDFIRDRQLADVTRRVAAVTVELTTLNPLLAEARIEAQDAAALRQACTGVMAALREPTTKKQRVRNDAAPQALPNPPASAPLPQETGNTLA